MGREMRTLAIINSVQGLIWTSQPDGVREYCSDAWHGLTAITQASATGANWNIPDRSTGDLDDLDDDDRYTSSTVSVVLANSGLRYDDGAGAQAM